jgi:hypothetical protein
MVQLLLEMLQELQEMITKLLIIVVMHMEKEAVGEEQHLLVFQVQQRA